MPLGMFRAQPKQGLLAKWSVRRGIFNAFRRAFLPSRSQKYHPLRLYHPWKPKYGIAYFVRCTPQNKKEQRTWTKKLRFSSRSLSRNNRRMIIVARTVRTGICTEKELCCALRHWKMRLGTSAAAAACYKRDIWRRRQYHAPLAHIFLRHARDNHFSATRRRCCSRFNRLFSSSTWVLPTT